MSLSDIVNSLRARTGARGEIVHSIGTLAGGTAFAQGLTVLATPVLTRLYTPADFSILAVYTSLLSILSVVACLRLEIAIPIPEKDEDAANLLAMALCISTAISIGICVLVTLFPSQITSLMGVPSFSVYLWLVPVGVWFASTYAAVQFWSTRKKKFTRIARTRMSQALGGVGTQVSVGWVGIGPFGLLLGNVVSSGAGIFGLARDAWHEDRCALRAVKWSRMSQLIRDYSRFPKYSSLDALANTAGIQIPVIIIAALAIGPEAGYLMLATKVMAMPMGLIGGSVSQVYLAHAPEKLREGQLETFTTQILSGLVKAGVGPLLFAGIIAPPVFAIVFGAEWRRAGELVAWMTPWFVFQFMSSPVSMVMHVTNRQRAMLAITITGMIIRIGGMLIAYVVAQKYFVETYAISGGVYYLICFVLFYRAAGVNASTSLGVISRTVHIWSPWIGLGVVARCIVS